MNRDDLLTSGQAAAIVGVTDETIRRWAEDGKVRHMRLPSGRFRFRRSDIEALLEVVEPEVAAS